MAILLALVILSIYLFVVQPPNKSHLDWEGDKRYSDVVFCHLCHLQFPAENLYPFTMLMQVHICVYYYCCFSSGGSMFRCCWICGNVGFCSCKCSSLKFCKTFCKRGTAGFLLLKYMINWKQLQISILIIDFYIQIAVRAGGFSAIVVVGMAVLGVAILYATFYVWLGVDSPGSMKVTDCKCHLLLLIKFFNETYYLNNVSSVTI